MEKDSFGVVDYVVFSIMLLISALIGVWQACVGGKQNTTAEYLLADRRMNFLPVSISVLVSYLSAISLLGLPAEIFFYGTQFYLTIIGMVLTCCVANAIFLPMFRRIRITCVNEVRIRACFFRGPIATGHCNLAAIMAEGRLLYRVFKVRARTDHHVVTSKFSCSWLWRQR